MEPSAAATTGANCSLGSKGPPTDPRRSADTPAPSTHSTTLCGAVWLLSGTVPFASETAMAVMLANVTQAPPELSTLRPAPIRRDHRGRYGGSRSAPTWRGHERRHAQAAWEAEPSGKRRKGQAVGVRSQTTRALNQIRRLLSRALICGTTGRGLSISSVLKSATMGCHVPFSLSARTNAGPTSP
jgi:enamine deaminase RidA (YjgF/YER057c/UK114 family)